MKRFFNSLIMMLMLCVMPEAGIASQRLTLMLDWFPNVDHLPVYLV